MFIVPPKYHPLLDSSTRGMDPNIIYTPDAQAALVDLLCVRSSGGKVRGLTCRP